jgi:hypothetical protein
LATSSSSRWLKISDKRANEISRREIPPFSDLALELQAEADHWEAAGWVMERSGGASPQGLFFMNCNGDRHMIAIMPSAGPLPKNQTGEWQTHS